jgi:ubiquitin-conjugating enzyme E2 J1
MSPTIRRLMKEAAELSASSSSPSPHFCAHPVSDSNLFDWHFTMAGPPAPSPYAGGIYHGRIVLPPTYPLRPPSFRFLTPSGRFEVNREICLSISGHHEESWQPAWGIRTALTAIRSFMDGDAKGQLGGLDATDEVRKMWAERSRSWSCDCMEGKTNEQFLNEWREVCLEKGVSVDDEGRETVPEELRMSYKKQSEEAKSQSEKTEEAISSEATSEQQSQEPIPVPQETSTAAEPERRARPAQSVPQPTPTRTTTTTTTTTTTNTIQTTTRANPSPQDNPWLDRAIVGVVIALLFMIMRRMAAADDL